MSTCAVKFAISVCAGVPLSDWLYKLEFRLVWNSNFAWNKLLSNLDMSTCAVKYEILVWAGVPQSQTGVEIRVRNLKMSICAVKYKKNWFGLGYLYLTRLFYCVTVFYVTLRYIMVTYCFTLRCLTVFCSKFDMSTCAVKYEILVWAGVSLSDPFILLFYGVLCDGTLRYIMVSYCFTLRCFTVFSSCQPVQLNMKFRVGLRNPSLTNFEIRAWHMSTCAVKYDILVWAGVSLILIWPVYFIVLRCFMLRYVTLHYGVLLFYVTVFYCVSSGQPVQLNMKFRVGMRYPSLTGFEIRIRNLDMSTCAVKYEILVWAGVSLSDLFILLFHGVLCYVTLHNGVLLFYVTVFYCFRCVNLCSSIWNFWRNSGSKFDMSTCAVKYE